MPKDYFHEFQRLGYEKIVREFSKKVILQASNILTTVFDSEISSLRKKAFTKLLQKRIGEFENVK